jgi:hypothetical protein
LWRIQPQEEIAVNESNLGAAGRKPIAIKAVAASVEAVKLAYADGRTTLAGVVYLHGGPPRARRPEEAAKPADETLPAVASGGAFLSPN